MISALQWVRRGAAQARPDKYDLDEKEFKRINDFAAQHLADAKEELAAAQKAENEYVCELLYWSHEYPKEQWQKVKQDPPGSSI